MILTAYEYAELTGKKILRVYYEARLCFIPSFKIGERVLIVC